VFCPAEPMRKLVLIRITIAMFLLAVAGSLGAQNKEPLRLVETIVMPRLRGRIDHMDVDLKGQRLFISGLENGSVEVVDLAGGKWTRSIPGFGKPQGIAYVAALTKLFVASGDDGMLRVFHGDSLTLEASIKLAAGPNRLAYDPSRKLIYVGYGGKEVGQDYGQVAIINAKNNRVIGRVRVAAHPSQIILDPTGAKAFVEVPVADQIQVIDTKGRRVMSTWPVSSHRPGDMGYDPSRERLFLGTHSPPEMIVMDSKTGKELSALPTVDGMDGVFFDESRRRVYVSGGRGSEVGSIFVYQQHDPDRYELIAKIPSRAGAGTSLWVPELNRLYVAAPATDEDAGILVFEAQQ
jgi:DNA-binding beta-propeller fold protein YncE